MATALAIDPASEPRTSASDVQMAIVSGGRAGFRHPHQIVTDIWVRREAAWRAPAARNGG